MSVIWLYCSSSLYWKSLFYTGIVLAKDISFNVVFLFWFSRNVPFRVRIRLARKRNEDEDSIHKLYTLVTHVPVATFKGKSFIVLKYTTLELWPPCQYDHFCGGPKWGCKGWKNVFETPVPPLPPLSQVLDDHLSPFIWQFGSTTDIFMASTVKAHCHLKT